MDLGEPVRELEITPAEDPVPREPQPEREPVPEREPETVPA